MPRTFSDADFAQEGAQQASGITDPIMQQAVAPPRSFGASDFETEDALPTYANGLSPQTAINSSPISVEDRAKLAIGNDAGRKKYLQERFKAVDRTKEGDFVVQDDKGLWRRIDPEGLGDGDAWSMTKELMSDASDLIRPGAQVAAQIGTAAGLAAATGGASLLAQGATSAATAAAVESGLTSLGRLVGTYDATPEEQLRDIGIEAALNFGGTYIAAGIKPTLGYVAEGLKKTGQKLGSMMPGAREAFTDTLGTLTGAGPRAFETLLDNPEAVSNAMKKASFGKKTADDAALSLANSMTDAAEEISKAARPAATRLYDTMAKEVIENVPETFNAELKSVTSAGLEPLKAIGLVADDAGRLSIKAPKQFVDELTARAAQDGSLSPLITDKQSLGIIREAAEAYVRTSEARSLSGAAGAKQVMDLKRILSDATYRLKEQADDAALAPAQKLLAQMKSATDAAISRKFEMAAPVNSRVLGKPSTNLFNDLNTHYTQQMAEMQPLMRASAMAAKSGSREPYAQLAQHLNSLGGRNSTKKTATDTLIDTLNSMGGIKGQQIAGKYQEIKNLDAATRLMPMIRRGIVSQTAAAGAGAALLSGNPMIAAGVAGSAALTSPRLAATAVKGALAGKAMLAKLNPVQLKMLASDPQAMQAWGQGVLGAAGVQNQAFNQLMQQGMSAVSGGR